MNKLDNYNTKKKAFLYELFELYHEYSVTISHSDASCEGRFILNFEGSKSINKNDMEHITNASISIYAGKRKWEMLDEK